MHNACMKGFGVPNRRKRVLMLASMHGDARDVLLAQVGWVMMMASYGGVVECDRVRCDVM